MKTTVLTLIAIAIVSCKNDKVQNPKEEGHNNHHGGTEKHESDNGIKAEYNASKTSKKYSMFVQDYLQLKDALVADDVKAAATAGAALSKSIETLDIEDYENDHKNELKEIIEVVKEHGEHIAKSDIGHQREHFNALGTDMVDLLEITGTSNTLYQQFCPMYNNNKGGTWISAEEEVRNPFFGAKMMKCGSVKKEIN